MKKLIQKPYLIFTLVIPIALLIGIIYGKDELDINVHDTYYVISYFHLSIIVSILFGILLLGYWLMDIANRKLFKWINWFHIMITITSIIIIFSIPYLPNNTYSPYNSTILDDLKSPSMLLLLAILFMVLAQLFFVINIIIGVFRKK